MIFDATSLKGVFEITPEPHRDDRGFFARLYCPEEFVAAGIEFAPTQVNLSANTVCHTLRGLHFQDQPHAESKLVRCIAGSAWDVAVDLRPGPDFLKWHAVVLHAEKMNALFLPEGMAHGFLTLEPNTQLLYHMGRNSVPGKARGLLWNDPALAIDWPFEPASMSEADLFRPPLSESNDPRFRRL
jgi:dTDP-4-dehydrorhamnose 3,5-epimerase